MQVLILPGLGGGGKLSHLKVFFIITVPVLQLLLTGSNHLPSIHDVHVVAEVLQVPQGDVQSERKKNVTISLSLKFFSCKLRWYSFFLGSSKLLLTSGHGNVLYYIDACIYFYHLFRKYDKNN